MQRVALILLALTCLSAPLRAIVSPTVQRSAAEWLVIKVGEVRFDGKRVETRARVVQAFVSESKLQPGQVIRIAYDIEPERKGDRKLIGEPGQPTLLESGQVTFAFLDPVPEDGKQPADAPRLFTPAARSWSFLEPVGIWPEVRKALRMELPPSPIQP